MMWIICARIPAISRSTRVTKLTQAFVEWSVPFVLWRSQSGAFDEPEGSTRIIDSFPLISSLPKSLRYLVWMVVVAVRSRFEPPDAVYWCVGFESALPIALFHRRGQRFVFDNNDNFSKSHNFPKWLARCISRLEQQIANGADLHLIPGADRWSAGSKNLRILPNVPARRSLDAARKIAVERGYSRPATITIYACGWLTATRGLHKLEGALDELQRRGRDVVVQVAGGVDNEEAKTFISRRCVEYLGTVSNEMSLALCYRMTAMFTFYDPALEINRLAEPNKWGDCVATRTPFICNEEIVTIERFTSSGLCYACGYDDVNGLADTICHVFDEHDFSKSSPVESFSAAKGWESLVEDLLREFGLLNTGTK